MKKWLKYKNLPVGHTHYTSVFVIFGNSFLCSNMSIKLPVHISLCLNMPVFYHLCLFWAASLRAASCSSWVSHSSAGSWTYRTTDPRIKQFFTDNIWGYLSGSVTVMSVNFMFRNWSTECRVPQILRSFFNSTTTSFPTSDLKKE